VGDAAPRGGLPAATAARPRVAVVGTGGTVAFVGRHALDLYEYVDHGRCQEAAELVARFPEVGAAAEVLPVAYRAIPSSAVTPRDWLALDGLVHGLVERQPALAGVVITHGTATLEETAYFLNLTLRVDVPVVLVGAQRPANALSTDAGMNLLHAVRVAASPEARGVGVLVVLNDEIHAAREVTKTSTYRLHTFQSPGVGPLGSADPDGRVVIYRRPVRRHAPATEFDVRGHAELPRVDIAYSYAGVDGAAVDAFVAAGARAIVSAGMAPGLPSPAELEALRAARAKGVVVVQASRAGSGRVLRRRRLVEDGFVTADSLNPQKARVLAMVALTVAEDVGEMQRMFDEY
jgi:L-asparaginase